MRMLLYSLGIAAVTAVTLQAQPPAGALGKYRLILEKELFGGEEPETVAPPPARPTPAPPGWARDYRMTMMTYDEDNDVVRIGLQNVRDQSALLLIEGDDSDPAFRLTSADFDRGQATVTRHGAPHLFSLEEGPRLTAANTAPTLNRNRPAQPSPTRRTIQPPRPNDANPTPVPRSRFNSSEELREHLKQVQMDALRSGKPPLPIPLTREMDDQLVKEGVLPPRNSE